MHTKRGLSPIIATILLMAFAVALGAMIMNWSSKLVASGAKEERCKQSAIKLRNPLCQTEDGIRVHTVNNGDIPLSSIAVTFNTSDTYHTIRLNTGNISTGGIRNTILPIQPPDTFTAHVYPVVHTAEGEATCPEPSHTTKEIPTC